MAEKTAILIGYLPNPRIYKRIALEKRLGEVHLVCWDRAHNMHLPPREDGYTLHCIHLDGPSDPLRRLIPYARFSRRAEQILLQIQPDVIHVQGLDMLRIACRVKKRSRKPVEILYEIPDLHGLQVEPQHSLLRRLAQRYVRAEDRRLCRQIRLLIVTSEKFVQRYYGRLVPAEKIFFFPNVPDPEAFRDYRKKPAGTPMTVGFIGILTYKQQMKDLVYAARRCDMELLIAGLENEPTEVEPLCRAYPKGTWVGRYDFARDAAALYGRCDVIHCVYDTRVENVKVLLPNKLYEAVWCELPILVAKDTYAAEIVEEWGVGLTVDSQDPEDLVRALQRLRDDRDLYDSLVSNCRKHRQDVELERYDRRLEEILRAL